MMIKYYKDIKCNCGNLIYPRFHELYFNMINGEIFDNLTDDIVCDKCGAVYELVDMKFIPQFERKKQYER